jgi:hypothetical protein
MVALNHLPRIQSGDANIELLLENLRIAATEEANQAARGTIGRRRRAAPRSDERRAADEAWRSEFETTERIRPFIAMANDPFDFDESKHQNRMLENALTPGYVFTDTDLHDIKYIHEENDLWLDTHPGNRGRSRECAFIGNAFLARYPNRSVRNEIYLLAANQINLQESDNEFESDSESESEIEVDESAMMAASNAIGNENNPNERALSQPIVWEDDDFIKKIEEEAYENLVEKNLEHLRQLELNAEILNCS